MIKHIFKKSKEWISENKKSVLLAVGVFFVSVASFGVGRLSAVWDAAPLVVEADVPTLNPADLLPFAGGVTLPDSASGTFVASKNSHYYYLPTCSTAKRIKPENQVWFQTEAEAQRAGFVRGSNCF